MAARTHDVSAGHFEWLVTARSANQKATLELYTIIDGNGSKLERNVDLQQAAQSLTSIAFSLWRAVFLSDTTGEYADRLADVKTFLVSLISDNTVLYVTDKNARNWSFRYYLDNALYRLHGLSELDPKFLDAADLTRPAASEKDEWLNAQAALDTALRRFAVAVDGRP